MTDLCNKKICSGCGACVNACFKNAITMTKNSLGFLEPEINKESCVKCGICDKTCKIIMSAHRRNEILECRSYQADSKTCLSSASGGFFMFAARWAVSKGWTVCGAVYDECFTKIKLVIAHTIEELEPMRKSKYFASTSGYVYREIKELLKSGESVLFFGLPCQVEGLKAYLEVYKSYDSEHLVTVDLICHGSGSPEIWQMNLKAFCKSKGKDLEDVNAVDFRLKPEKNGKKLEIKLQNESYVFSPNDFPYYYGFQNRYLMRMSCYGCRFGTIERSGDLSIGDMIPIDNEGLGRSVIMVNTPEGKNFANFIKLNDNSQLLSDAETLKLKQRITAMATVATPKYRSKIKVTSENNYRKLCNTYFNKSYVPFKYRFLRAIKNILKSNRSN